MSVRRLTLSILCALAAAIGVYALASPSALAFTEHITPPTSFGEPCSGSPCGRGQLSDPDGLAIEQSTGDVYVVDAGDDRVKKFTASGMYLSQFGGAGSSAGQLESPTWVAVSESAMGTDVYVADPVHDRVEEFESDGAYVSELTGTATGSGGAIVPFREVGGLTTDPSGNVWVGAGENLDEFSPQGAFVRKFTSSEYSNEHTISQLVGLAVNSEGDIFGFHSSRTFGGNGNVSEWSPTGIAFGEFDKELPTSTFQDTGVTIDPGSATSGGKDDVYIAANEYIPIGARANEGKVLNHFQPSCAVESSQQESRSGCEPLESFGLTDEPSSGIAVDGATGAVYVARPDNHSVQVFAATILPDAITSEVTEAQSSSAVLTGVVNPDGTVLSSCGFEYLDKPNFNQVAIIETWGNKATGGTFSVNFSRSNTSYLAEQVPYGATAREVETALVSLPLIDEGDVSVTGPDGGPYRVEFKGALANSGVPLGSFLEVSSGEESSVSGANVRVTNGDWTEAVRASCSSKPTGSGAVPVAAEVTGLEPEQEYDYRLTSANSSGENVGSVHTFVTPVAPSVSNDSVAEVAPVTSLDSIRARVAARIDAGGLPTTYHVEYGEMTASGVSSSEMSAGSGVGAKAVTAELEGLRPATTYHFRFVAVNSLGRSEGEEISFTTNALSSASALLPDGRNYELVSSGDTRMGNVYVPVEYGGETPAGPPERSSLDGDALTYVGAPAVLGGNGNEGEQRGVSYLASRSANGWAAHAITPLNANYTAGFKVFSSDLSLGILTMSLAEQGGSTPIIPNGPGSGAYLRMPDGSFHLVAGPWAEGENERSEERNEGYRGGTPDLSRIVIEVKGDLYLEEPQSGYLSSALNVVPGGRTETGATFDAISTDGKDVVWGAEGRLYISENVGTTQVRTVQVDAARGSGPGGGGVFSVGPYGESPDDLAKSFNGSQVLFTDADSAGLTSDTEPGSGVNLYEFELASGKLVDLTSGAHAEVQGIAGTSEDGSYVYFLASAVLSKANAEGDEPVAGAANLYVTHDGVTSFIASQMIPRRVSSDGQHILLQSEVSGGVYVYTTDTGRLTCSSCVAGTPVAVTLGNNREAGASYNYFLERYVPHWMNEEGDRVFFEAGSLVPQDTIGSSVYEWEANGVGSCQSAGGCIYLISGGSSRAEFIDASENGDNVFFTTYGKLVPEDKNDYIDVYDARIGERLPVSPLCTGTGCQGVPPATPIFSTPSSATFNGVGNFEPTTTSSKSKPRAKRPICKKGLAKKKGKCARHKTKNKRAKRSSRRVNRGDKR